MISYNAMKKSVLTTTPVVIIAGAGNSMKSKLNEAVSVFFEAIERDGCKI